MIGHPKFKIDEKVKFDFYGQEKVGTVYIVDKFGTFEDNTDVSYDILVEEENILYKHFNEKYISKYEI